MKADSPKVLPDLSTVVLWCFPDQRLSRQPWVVFVWSPLFGCSPAVLLESPRLSPEIQGILAVAGMQLVVAARATGRLRFLTYPHPNGRMINGSANFVLSMGGRLEVVQSSGVRTFEQEMWRGCVCVWCALALRCKRPLRKETDFPFPSRAEVWRKDSLRNVLDVEICSTQLVSHRDAGGSTGPCVHSLAHLLVAGRSCFGRALHDTMLESGSSAVSEALVKGVAMALNHPR